MAEVNELSPQLIINILPYNKQEEVLLIKDNPGSKEWSILAGEAVLGQTIKHTVEVMINEHLGCKPAKIELISNPDSLNLQDSSQDEQLVFLNFLVEVEDLQKTNDLDKSRYLWLNLSKDLSSHKLSQSAKILIPYFNSYWKTASEDYQDKYQRSLADYQNLLKKTNREKEEFAKFALNDFLQELLPIYDHLKLSISSLPPAEKDNAWVTGVNHVLRQFKEVLNSHGVQEIVTVGAKFDHHTMEAVEGQGELVVKEISPGYQLNGRLLKPAKVIVASEPENNNKK